MKDAYYFKHDANARHDPKIKALINKYGIEGYGRFWIILEVLRESNGYKLEDEEYIWQALAEQMKTTTEEVKVFLSDCINKFKLFTENDGFIYSLPFLERMSKLEEIRQKRIYASKIRWEKEHGLTNDNY
jgi:hypothetical protein